MMVAAYLAEVRQEAAEEVSVDAKYVLRRLRAEAEREGLGSSHAARVSALGLLGKALAMFTEPEVISRPILIVTDVNQLAGTGDEPTNQWPSARPRFADPNGGDRGRATV